MVVLDNNKRRKNLDINNNSDSKGRAYNIGQPECRGIRPELKPVSSNPVLGMQSGCCLDVLSVEWCVENLIM